MLDFVRRWPLVLPALVMMALFVYMSWDGFGGTSDSKHYLWAAQTFRATGRLESPDGTPYRYWGPLYPLLLALFQGPMGVRFLHAGALLVYLWLWARVGQWLLPPGRALWLVWAVALSAAVLVPAKFIWAEAVFGALAAAYFYALLAWCRTGSGRWLLAATVAGFLLPLQRTSGLFLLAGAGVGLVLTGYWRGWLRWLVPHWVICVSGAIAWNYYAELVAGPPVYQAVKGWGAVSTSVADYGFVLARWFVPLTGAWRTALPTLWVVILPLILGALWPRSFGEPTAPESGATVRLRRLLWWVVVATLLALFEATNLTRAAAGIFDAERYFAVLMAPVSLLALANWPVWPASDTAQASKRWRLLGTALLAGWLGYSALRVGQNAWAQHKRPPISWPVVVQLPH